MLFSWVFIATDPRLFTLLALSSEGNLEGRASLSAVAAVPPLFLTLLRSSVSLLKSALAKVYQNKGL